MFISFCYCFVLLNFLQAQAYDYFLGTMILLDALAPLIGNSIFITHWYPNKFSLLSLYIYICSVDASFLSSTPIEEEALSKETPTFPFVKSHLWDSLRTLSLHNEGPFWRFPVVTCPDKIHSAFLKLQEHLTSSSIQTAQKLKTGWSMELSSPPKRCLGACQV